MFTGYRYARGTRKKKNNGLIFQRLSILPVLRHSTGMLFRFRIILMNSFFFRINTARYIFLETSKEMHGIFFGWKFANSARYAVFVPPRSSPVAVWLIMSVKATLKRT